MEMVKPKTSKNAWIWLGWTFFVTWVIGFPVLIFTQGVSSSGDNSFPRIVVFFISLCFCIKSMYYKLIGNNTFVQKEGYRGIAIATIYWITAILNFLLIILLLGASIFGVK